ncbi:hypothetical protein ES703_110569 [subsurface metagenome]
MLITIDKAITDLQARIDGEFNIKGVDECEDMKLGVEALKRVKACRPVDLYAPEILLPGETRD